MSVPAPPVTCCNPKHRHPYRRVKSHLPIRIAERFVPWIRVVRSSLPIMPAQRSKGERCPDRQPQTGLDACNAAAASTAESEPDALLRSGDIRRYLLGRSHIGTSFRLTGEGRQTDKRRVRLTGRTVKTRVLRNVVFFLRAFGRTIPSFAAIDAPHARKADLAARRSL